VQIIAANTASYEDDAGFPHQVDHIISQKHGGSSSMDNLAFACMLCNQRKGTDIASVDPATGNVISLFHPRRDQWSDHFRIVESSSNQSLESASSPFDYWQLNTVERQESAKCCNVSAATRLNRLKSLLRST